MNALRPRVLTLLTAAAALCAAWTQPDEHGPLEHGTVQASRALVDDVAALVADRR